MNIHLFFIGREEKNFFFEKRKVFFSDVNSGINNSNENLEKDKTEKKQKKQLEERNKKEEEEKLLLKQSEYTNLLEKVLKGNDAQAVQKINILQKRMQVF